MKHRTDIDRALRALRRQPPSVSIDAIRQLVYSGRPPRRRWASVWLARVLWR